MTKTFRYSVILIYLILWIAVAVVQFFLLYHVYNLESATAVVDSLVFNLLFCIMGIGLWFIVEYSGDELRSLLEEIIRQVTVGAVFIIIWTSVSGYLLRWIFEDNQPYVSFLNNSMSMRVVSGIMYYGLMIAFFYLLMRNRQLSETKEYEVQLTGQLREAELNMLRSQIRPHFLFNSLNSISALTLSDNAKAHEMIIKLSDFMRYSLTLQDETMSTLEKELYHIRLYLDIEKIRFGEKLKVDYHICEGCESWPLPAMILQPVIENAVKHGLYEATTMSGIAVNAFQEGPGMMKVSISNAFDPEVIPRRGTGTGLLNVHKRLTTVYKMHNLLSTSKENNLFTIQISLPFYGKDQSPDH